MWENNKKQSKNTWKECVSVEEWEKNNLNICRN